MPILKKSFFLLLTGAVLLLYLYGCLAVRLAPEEEIHYTLAILGTTDEKQYIKGYDYIENKEDGTIGLSRLYTMIEEARSEYEHTLLFSAGDILQGSFIGEMEAVVSPLETKQYQTIIKAFNHMEYDAVSVGNHDLTDFGLSFFETAKKNSNFPWLSSNIKKADNPSEFYIQPYTIIEKNIKGIPLKVGVISFIPPHTMYWGRRFLEEKIIVKEILPQAKKYIPILAEKSDIVVIVAHTGIDESHPEAFSARENAAYHLSLIEGVNAMVLGHQHRFFPGDFKDIDGIDNEKGLINGVPAVMAGAAGEALGIIELKLAHRKDGWKIVGESSRLRYTEEEISPHSDIEDIASDIHKKTLKYLNTTIGRTKFEIASYFSRIKDTAITQLINDAQLDYATTVIAETEYRDTPLLSAAAPFKAGGEGPNHFSSVKEVITIADVVNDIYTYTNNVEIVKINGNQLKDYLERSAYNFNTIDPVLEEPQHLINYEMSSFNYDVVKGIDYQLDITRPPGDRVVSLIYRGEEVEGEMEFLIVTNNYRASGGGGFPHMVKENLVLSTTAASRQKIIKYIQQQKEAAPLPTRNWSIGPVKTSGPLIYHSSPKARHYINENRINGLQYLETCEEGWGVYKIDLFKIR